MTSLSLPCRKIGDFTVTALSDGIMPASLDLLSGIAPSAASVIQRDAGILQPGDIHINSYLIQGRGRTLLVDAGAGMINNIGGQLIDKLSAVGVSVDQVDTVLLTHCHPDHIGGLLNTARQPVFKHAQIMLDPREAEHWWDDQKRDLANERGQRNFALVRETLTAYGSDVHFFTGEKIAQGIQPLPLPGHTPGHSGFRVEGHEDLLIWGDIVHYPHIQAAQPDVSIAFDTDPRQAQDTRRKILEYAAQENMLIAGMHLDHAGFARIQRTGSGYRISAAGPESHPQRR